MPTEDKYKNIIPIRYTSREFETIKKDLTEHAKRYYPSTYQDFSEASFGSLMMDTVAYVGDVLSFYLDYQVNESFIDTATEYTNVVRLGQQLGFKLDPSPSSYGIATFYVLVPASSTGGGPDTNYIPILKRGSKISTVNGFNFLLNEDVDFSTEENEIVVGAVSTETGLPSSYAIKAHGEVVSGRLIEERFTIAEFERFRTLSLTSNQISEIISVFDTAGNQYFEVDNLAQNVVYKEYMNAETATKNTVQSLLKPMLVPRRFVVEKTGAETLIKFGHGSNPKLESEPVPEPNSVVLKYHGKNYVTDATFDPTKLIETDKFGIAPSNTTIIVLYRANDALNVNAPAASLNSVASPILDFRTSTLNLSNSVINTIQSSLEVTNEKPIVGSQELPTTTELKIRIGDSFASQNRAVTKQDYVNLIYRMPSKFGSIKRCNIVRDPDSDRRNLNLYVISVDAAGRLLEANSALKKNLKTWLNVSKMINDTIDILDARIINFGINYEIVAEPTVNKYDLTRTASRVLQQKFSKSYEIGQPIYIIDVYDTLNRVPGVVDVIDVEVVPKSGGNYSDTYLDFELYKSPDGRYIESPENCVFELKFPETDVRGAVR